MLRRCGTNSFSKPRLKRDPRTTSYLSGAKSNFLVPSRTKIKFLHRGNHVRQCFHCTGDVGGGSLISLSFSTERTLGTFINCAIRSSSMRPLRIPNRGSARTCASPYVSQWALTFWRSAPSSANTITGISVMSPHLLAHPTLRRRRRSVRDALCELMGACTNPRPISPLRAAPFGRAIQWFSIISLSA